MTRQRFIFMLIHAEPEWLALAPRDRFAFLDTVIRPLLAAHPEVQLRVFDAEAYATRASDVLMFETGRLDRWESLVEGLRETAFWGRYFAVRDILPAVENGWASHYGEKPLAA